MNNLIIGIAGGSGSGKTTLACRLKALFGEDEVRLISHDSYYKRHDELPFEERCKLNYDHPDAFDNALLIYHLQELKAGRAIDCPVYDYADHNRSVELAKKYNVELEVLSSLNPVPGTVVKEVVKDVEGMLIKGVAKDTDVAVITILNVPDEPGTSFKIFGLLAQKNINVDIILQSTGRDGKKDISFTCAESEAETAMRVLREGAHFDQITCDETCAKVSIVGAGMQSHSGVASKMFEAMSNNNINIKMISTSEIKISCIIDREDADKAVSAIHDMLFE